MKKYFAASIFELQYLTPSFTGFQFNGQDLLHGNHQLTDEQLSKIKDKLDYWENHFVYLGLEFSLVYAGVIRERLKRPISIDQLSAEIEILNVRVDHELQKIVFGFIPKDKTPYFQQEQLFGKDVFENFPSARDEIKEAGNCYALNCNTACVFHLMRVVEIGIKAMHWQMTKRKNVVIEKYKKGLGTTKPKSRPIELCDWNTLITGLNLALEKLGQKKSSEVKRKELSFYSEAVKIFSNFKDAWRNNISHGNEIDREGNRKLFNEGETEDILKDTKRFMQLLAKRIKE